MNKSNNNHTGTGFCAPAFTAFIALAMAFILSCSSDGGGEPDDGKVPSGTPVSKSKITGVSHKGPFVIGSTVTLYELDSDLAQTGRAFTGSITDSKGSFKINNVDLVSSYALLEVNGFYLNEITGNKSAAPVTLKAVVDLANKDNVNVNLLTHLEYNRVMYLVEEGKSFAEAKEQAQQEVFAAFGIDGDFVNSEDMSIFDTSESSAALLAISVLLLNTNSDADFSELLTKVALGIENTGEWGDAAEKKAIAESFAGISLSGVKTNISEWESSEVPAFEKYVFKSLEGMHPSGIVCNSEHSEHESIRNKVKEGTDGKKYVCSPGNYFQEASVIEADVGLVCNLSTKDEIENEIKTGDSGKKYVCSYDGNFYTWRKATTIELDVGLVCNLSTKNEIENEIKTGDSGEKYVCDEPIIAMYSDYTWRKATTIELDLGLVCNSSIQGEMKIGANEKKYVCVPDVYGKSSWREVGTIEVGVEYYYEASHDVCTVITESMIADGWWGIKYSDSNCVIRVD